MRSTSNKPAASVVITTKNRRHELCEAVRSAVRQSVPVEVLVIDDGSLDGTAEMIRTQFPTVRLDRSESSFGLIVQRNRAARLATGDILFSLDDDAVFASRDTVEKTLLEFDNPKVGAVAIPYIEPQRSSVLRQKAPDEERVYATDRFIGTAYAVRRDVFLRLGGYREFFVHQGEEGDFCLRMLAAGWYTVLGTSGLIHHFESSKRDYRRMDFYGCRNAVLDKWLNTPFRYLPFHLAGTTMKCLVWSLEPRRLAVRVWGLLVGYRQCLSHKRGPVAVSAYRQFRKLSHRPIPVD
jgi:GT2 family glycosyltransferase